MLLLRSIAALFLPLFTVAHPFLNLTHAQGAEKVTELELRALQGPAPLQLLTWAPFLSGRSQWLRCAIWIQPDGFFKYALNFELRGEDHVWHVLDPPTPIRARPDGPFTAAAHQWGADVGEIEIRLFFHKPESEGIDPGTSLPRHRMQSAIIKSWVW
jgi:hypothetical protein